MAIVSVTSCNPVQPRFGHVQQNDPGELLEVFDALGQPTGVARERSAIHLNGDWHQAFHCWILRGGGREVVLQQRSRAKDTFGGRWDATAAGHWRFGETAAEAAREIAEELGLEVAFTDLVYRGREISDRAFPSGLIDREHHQVYVLERDGPLAAYRPDAREVIALAAFPAVELVQLMAGEREALAALEAVAVEPTGAPRPSQVSVTRVDVVPYSAARLRRMLGWA